MTEATSNEFSATDMATAAAQGFRDGVASVRPDPVGQSATVAYHVGAAETEAAIRAKLIELGWTPPRDDGAPVESAMVVPEGWKLVKIGHGCVTSSMKAACIGEFSFGITMACGECVDCGADSDCPVCGGEVEYTQRITAPWDTCKEIYKAMLDAAPTPEPASQPADSGEVQRLREAVSALIDIAHERRHELLQQRFSDNDEGDAFTRHRDSRVGRIDRILQAALSAQREGGVA